MQKKRQAFTLIEILVAISIFAVGTVYLIERRSAAMESGYYTAQLLRAHEVADEIIQFYRLHPFREEPYPLEKDYSPFVVNVNVQPEAINSLPQEWQLTEYEMIGEEEKKERIILRVTVSVGFGSLLSPDPAHYKYEITTLIRLVQLEEGQI